MEMKKRVQWKVDLYRYNLSERKDYYPRVRLLGRVTTDYLANELERRTGIYRSDSVKAILSLMSNLVEEYLIEGYAVTGKLGTLLPSVTGMWSFDRTEPSERARNEATVRYIMSPRMKESLSDPLFHGTVAQKATPHIDRVENVDADEEGREEWHVKDLLIIHGRFLLMNGDAPERGLYFVEEGTGRVTLRIDPEDFRKNTRTEIMIRVPALAAGRYRLRVISQCTTSPRPLKQPKTGETRNAWTISEAQAGG